MKINNSLSNKSNRLGRGLDVLLGPSKELTEVISLDIEKIQPNKDQPRQTFDKETLEKLCASIKENGVLQPILVEKRGDKYQIIAGERRWRACCMAGLHKIPVLVKSPDPKQKSVWALIENLQREDLNPIEKAQAFNKIMKEENISQEALASSLGQSRSSLANFLRLLQLDKEVQKLVSDKKISFAQARELLRFKSPKTQRNMAKACLKQALTVQSLSLKAEGKKVRKTLPFWAKKALSHLERQFSKRLRLDYSKGKGRLVFSFQSDTELKNLLNKLWNK